MRRSFNNYPHYYPTLLCARASPALLQRKTSPPHEPPKRLALLDLAPLDDFL
jgi:hypothetical protein